MKRSAINSWGPGAWTLLHTISFTYPIAPNIQDMENMHSFLLSFALILPCARCRVEFIDLLKTSLGKTGITSVQLKSRDTFSRFMVDAHNSVNRRLNYKEVEYSTVKRWYTEQSNSYVSIAYVFGIVVVCLLVVRMITPIKKTKRPIRPKT